MNIKKIVVTKGFYNETQYKVLLGIDSNEEVVDLIFLDHTRVGRKCVATVEKVLNDIDASILKLDIGEKGFIENKKLIPEEYLLRHSTEKKVCQNDVFSVWISQDKKGNKAYSCGFAETGNNAYGDFISYYISLNCVPNQYSILTDDKDTVLKYTEAKFYFDDEISLWNLYSVTSIVDKALKSRVYLKSGGNIVIEHTEALTVIDVNSGSNYGKAGYLKTNTEAARKIAKEIRLRNISGMIIIDFLKMNKAEEQSIIECLKKESSDDFSSVAIHSFTRMGLLEMTRSRMLMPINEIFKK